MGRKRWDARDGDTSCTSGPDERWAGRTVCGPEHVYGVVADKTGSATSPQAMYVKLGADGAAASGSRSELDT